MCSSDLTVNSGQPRFYSALEGVFPTDYLRHKYFLRADWQMSQSQNVFVRYGKDWEHIDCEGCGGTNAAFNQSYVESPRDTTVVGHTWVVSNRALNELRVQGPANLKSTTGPPGTSLWDRPGEFPAERFKGYTQVYNFPSMHWGSNTGSLNFTRRFELKDDFSYSVGQHQWKFGAEYARYISPEDVIANTGTWTFATDQFFDGTPAAIAALRNPTVTNRASLENDYGARSIAGRSQAPVEFRPGTTAQVSCVVDQAGQDQLVSAQLRRILADDPTPPDRDPARGAKQQDNDEETQRQHIERVTLLEDKTATWHGNVRCF